MPRFPRKELPAGFALREFPPDVATADSDDGSEPEYPQRTYQAFRQNDPTQESPRYTRRLKAVEWCWMKLGEEADAAQRG